MLAPVFLENTPESGIEPDWVRVWLKLTNSALHNYLSGIVIDAGVRHQYIAKLFIARVGSSRDSNHCDQTRSKLVYELSRSYCRRNQPHGG
jgi:hypothetical protein